MSEIDNPPAFPVKVKRNTSSDPLATPREFQMQGMTLRDWFAGQALAGISSCLTGAEGKPIYNIIAQDAYAMADALLAERKETSEHRSKDDE